MTGLELKYKLLSKYMEPVKYRNRKYGWIYTTNIPSSEDIPIYPNNDWLELIKRLFAAKKQQFTKWLYSLPSYREWKDERNPSSLYSKRNSKLFHRAYEIEKNGGYDRKDFYVKFLGGNWHETYEGRKYIEEELRK